MPKVVLVIRCNDFIAIMFSFIQSNEVKSSYAMELGCLQPAFAFLEDLEVNDMSLTTDRHSSVKKWMVTRIQIFCTSLMYGMWLRVRKYH